jgi:hypothetical protein
MDTTTRKNLWEFLEEDDDRAPEAKALFQWSLNFDHGNRPWELYLDIIQYSADWLGGDQYVGWKDDTRWAERTRFRSIGYMEADYLGDALKEWALNPHRVEKWIDALMDCED